MSASSATRLRRERRAAVVCVYCGDALDAGSTQCCSLHLAKNRERNRDYEQRLRDSSAKTPQRTISLVAKERRHRHQVAIVAFAIEHQRVPTLPEVARIIGKKHPTSAYVQQLRLDAFGLRPLRSGRRVIPFPVPVELQREDWQ